MEYFSSEPVKSIDGSVLVCEKYFLFCLVSLVWNWSVYGWLV